MTKKNIIIIGLIIIAIIFVTGILIARLISPEDNWICNNLGQWVKHGNPSASQPLIPCGQKATTPSQTTSLPNPASVHCEEVGGSLDIRTGADGGQVGYCIFPDKSECEEWALLRNECVGNEDFRNLNIKAGDQIKSPLKITGEVKGGWFFEGSFPINLVDWDGRIIAVSIAQAKTDWMTVDYVSFTAELKFTVPPNMTNQEFAKHGAIIFKNDNPSGLPANDKTYELPIKF